MSTPARAAVPARRSDWLLGQLPMGMLDDGFFTRFVSLFQEVATTLLEGADNISNVVDPTVAPPEMVRWLGSWIGMHSVDASLPEELQRLLVRESSRSLAWRGTRAGLERYLGAITGAPVRVAETGGIHREGESGSPAPWVRVTVASTGWMSEEDFVTLVADEIPANAALEVHLGGRQLWPAPAPARMPAPAVPGSAVLPGADPGDDPDDHPEDR